LCRSYAFCVAVHILSSREGPASSLTITTDWMHTAGAVVYSRWMLLELILYHK
jgi:hypothetical protein